MTGISGRGRPGRSGMAYFIRRRGDDCSAIALHPDDREEVIATGLPIGAAEEFCIRKIEAMGTAAGRSSLDAAPARHRPGKHGGGQASVLPVPTGEMIDAARRTGRGLLRRLPEGWSCPCCDRDLRQIVRWSPRQRNWFAAVVSHHDHQFNRRFPRTVICQDCNDVDANVKNAFPELVRRGWSFSPAEIRQVISAAPHQKHDVDFPRARQLALDVLAGKSERTEPQLRLEL